MEPQLYTHVDFYTLCDVLTNRFSREIYEEFLKRTDVYFDILEKNHSTMQDIVVIPYKVDLCNHDPVDIAIRSCLGHIGLQNCWIFLTSLDNLE